MGQVVSAIFDNPGDAAGAIDELRNAGIGDEAISVIGQNRGFLLTDKSEESGDPSTALANCRLGEDECAFYEARLAKGGMFVAVDAEADDIDPASAVAILYSWRGESAPDLRQVA